jgi:hypothetical protein
MVHSTKFLFQEVGHLQLNWPGLQTLQSNIEITFEDFLMKFPVAARVVLCQVIKRRGVARTFVTSPISRSEDVSPVIIFIFLYRYSFGTSIESNFPSYIVQIRKAQK